MFLDKKTVLKIWPNPGLNLTVVRGTGPRSDFIKRCTDAAKSSPGKQGKQHHGNFLDLTKLYNDTMKHIAREI